MARKGSSKGYTSKGTVKTVSQKLKNAMRRDRTAFENFEGIYNAYLKGKNPWLTIDNPNKNETSKRRIRVRTNDYWGMPKLRVPYNMFGGKTEEKKEAVVAK